MDETSSPQASDAEPVSALGLRAAARATAVGTVLGGAVLLRYGGVHEAIALLPLAAGLFALMSEKTWGGFATLGGSALVCAAVALGGLPLWVLALGLGGLAVSLPPLIQAVRFDASAAMVWVALAGLFGGGTALAWDAIEEEHGCDALRTEVGSGSALPKEVAPPWRDAWQYEASGAGFQIHGSVTVF